MTTPFAPDKGSYFTLQCKVREPRMDGTSVRSRCYVADVFVSDGVDDRLVLARKLTSCDPGDPPERLTLARHEWDFYPAGPQIIEAVRKYEQRATAEVPPQLQPQQTAFPPLVGIPWHVQALGQYRFIDGQKAEPPPSQRASVFDKALRFFGKGTP